MSRQPIQDNEPICLIIPPSAFLLDERVFMSLGVLKIAAMIEDSGRQVEVLDLSGVKDYTLVVAQHVKNSNARIFGVTATTPQMPAVRRIVEVLRLYRPAGKLILGGPHGTLCHAARRRELHLKKQGRAVAAMDTLLAMFDVIVVGDGEIAVFEALKPDAAAIIDGDDPKTPLFLTNEALEKTPFPARHLVDVNSYKYSIDGIQACSMIAQLGCPFGCGFCGGRQSPSLRHIRTRSTDSVVREVRELYETYGYKAFMLYDDELNVNPEIVTLMNALADLQDELGEEFRFRGFLKSQLFTDEQAKSMVRAGFRWILVGFESGAPRILKNINKRATLEENTRCMEIAHRHDLKVKALMSVGHPGESAETIEQTKQWLLRVQPADFDASVITTYPGTPYFDQAIPDLDRPGVWTYTYPATGDRLHSVDVDYTVTADYYKGDPDGGYKAFVFTDHLSSEELVRLRDDLETEIRADLGIPFNPGAPGIEYEHSMGLAGKTLPANLLRNSTTHSVPQPSDALLKRLAGRATTHLMKSN